MPVSQDDTNAERQRRYRERRRTGGAKLLELYLPPHVTAALEAMGAGETPRRRIEAAIIALVTGAKRAATVAPGENQGVTVTPIPRAIVAVGTVLYMNWLRRIESATIVRLSKASAYLDNGQRVPFRDLEMARVAQAANYGRLWRVDRDADSGVLAAALTAAHRIQRIEGGKRRPEKSRNCGASCSASIRTGAATRKNSGRRAPSSDGSRAVTRGVSGTVVQSFVTRENFLLEKTGLRRDASGEDARVRYLSCSS